MWPRLETRAITLTIRHFLPESVVMPGGFQEQPMVVQERPGNRLSTQQQEKGEKKTTGILAQEAEVNPDSILEM